MFRHGISDDGLLEVIGVTTYQLPLLHAGGHGYCITQVKGKSQKNL
jgi:diacylglycerol kinase (ATP)